MHAMRRRAAWFLASVTIAGVATFLGWRLMWFLTDDAFIHFRYVANSVAGHGYVFNPPPFAPVEGYTSFLWVVLLDVVWRLAGILPPDSANVLSLGCSLLTLALTAHMVLELRLPDRLERARPWLLVLVLAGLVTNRTFLTWSSSGLETALFNFLVLLWFQAALGFSSARTTARAGWLSTATALLYLTRPEGLVFAAATLVALALGWLETRRTRGLALAALPLLAIPIHLLWRHFFYGAWLPNTYYAKHVAAWPLSGLHYLVSYGLEHAMWLWVLPFALFGPRLLASHLRALAAAGGPRGWVEDGLIRDLAVVTVLFNAGYYTFVIGGDAFEYRVYSNLVPLYLLALAWILAAVDVRPARALGFLAAFALLSCPIAWLHYRVAREVPAAVAADEDTAVLVAGHLPGPLQWYGHIFDGEQVWLIDHLVCGRHHSHLHFTDWLLDLYPDRQPPEGLPQDDIPVLAVEAAGVPGWTLPDVAILDVHGLNDFVVARTPTEAGERRQMAHDRRPPQEYYDALSPNVELDKSRPGNQPLVSPRALPLTAEDIRSIEAEWWERARAWARER
jgi:arabinofuranosyltransferase